jgi:hypothetical protein
MSTRYRPQWIEQHIDGGEGEATRSGDRIGESKRAEWSIPNDPREQRRIRNRLIALAVALPIARLLRLLFG